MHPVDGKISLAELIKVTKAEENVGDSFYAADKNGDGAISRSPIVALSYDQPDSRYMRWNRRTNTPISITRKKILNLELTIPFNHYKQHL